MTVIVVRDGVMAADTASWCGQIIVAHRNKIRRLHDGRLFAGTGERASADACFDWLDGRAEKPPPEERDAFAALILGPGGIERVDYKFRTHADNQEFAFAGAHGELLFGALAAGASAEEAVRIAIRYGDSAGGEVQVERL